MCDVFDVGGSHASLYKVLHLAQERMGRLLALVDIVLNAQMTNRS